MIIIATRRPVRILSTFDALSRVEGCCNGGSIMADKVRLNLQVSSELNQMLEDIADSAGTNRTDVVRQALALMKTAHAAKRDGRHIGIVTDPKKLDTEIVGLL